MDASKGQFACHVSINGEIEVSPLPKARHATGYHTHNHIANPSNKIASIHDESQANDKSDIAVLKKLEPKITEPYLALHKRLKTGFLIKGLHKTATGFSYGS